MVGSFSKCFIVLQEWIRLSGVGGCLPGRVSSSGTQHFYLSRVASALMHIFLPRSLPPFIRRCDDIVFNVAWQISYWPTEEIFR